MSISGTHSSPGSPGPVRLSAVILSFNSAAYLETCIRSLAASLQHAAERDEILVVENGSRDDSPAILKRLEAAFPGLVTGIYSDRNLGTTVSRNLALKRARGRYLLIMDSDVEVPPGTIDCLIERVEGDRACGIAVPRLLYPDGRLQLSTDRFPTIGRKLRRFIGLKSMEQSMERAMERKTGGRGGEASPHPVDYAISAFWLLRREVWERVGPLDERIFYSPEDVDYCLRVWKAGYRVLYDPAVHAIHDAQEISRGRKIGAFTWRHAKGLAYLFGKHRYALGRGRLYRRIARAQRTAP